MRAWQDWYFRLTQLWWLLWSIQQIDSMLPCVCSVIEITDDVARTVAHCVTDVLPTIWRHLLSNATCNMESFCFNNKKQKKWLWNHLWACLQIDHNKNQSKCYNNSTYYINPNKNSFRKNLGFKVYCLPIVAIFNLSTLENYLIDRNWFSNLFLNSKNRFRNSINVPSTIVMYGVMQCQSKSV